MPGSKTPPIPQDPSRPASVRPYPHPAARWIRLALLPALAAAAGFLLFMGDPFGRELAEVRATGVRPSPHRYAHAWVWWMTLLNTPVLLVLFFTWRRWGAPAPAATHPVYAARAGWTRWRVVGVAAAMGVLASQAAPRLDHSLWGDERYMARHSIAGMYELESDGRLRFDRVRWDETFFHYRKPNNHVPYSILARLGWEGYRVATQPEDLRPPEPLLRLPALAAGLAGLATLAALLLRLGFPVAAVAGAWLLALHPWYLRFASEVRGYALLLALIPALVLTAVRVLERGDLRRWGVYACVQTLLLWTYPGALFVLVVLNVFVLVELLRRGAALRGGGEAQLLRFLVMNGLAALAWLQVNLANMMQFLDYSQTWRGEIDVHFLEEAVSLFLVGTHVRPPDKALVTLDSVIAQHPWLMPAVLATATLALLAGAWRLARRGAPGRVALAALVLPAPLTLLLVALRGDHLYAWYLIHGFPGVAALIALGLGGLGALARSERWRPLVAGAALAAFLASFAVVTEPMRRVLRTTEVEPNFAMLDLLGLDRDDPTQEPAIRLVGIYTTPTYYEPYATTARTPEALIEALREADAAGEPLYLTYDRLALVRKRRPEVLALAVRRDLLEPVASLEGVFPKYRREVLRYRPGSVSRLADEPTTPQ